jgi:hypothetical protein
MTQFKRVNSSKGDVDNVEFGRLDWEIWQVAPVIQSFRKLG